MYSTYTYAYATRVERNCDDLRRARIPAKPTKKSEKKTKKDERRKKGIERKENREAEGIRKEKRIVRNSRTNESSLFVNEKHESIVYFENYVLEASKPVDREDNINDRVVLYSDWK